MVSRSAQVGAGDRAAGRVDGVEVRYEAGGQYVEDGPIACGGDQQRFGSVLAPPSRMLRSGRTCVAMVPKRVLVDGLLVRILTSA